MFINYQFLNIEEKAGAALPMEQPHQLQHRPPWNEENASKINGNLGIKAGLTETESETPCKVFTARLSKHLSLDKVSRSFALNSADATVEKVQTQFCSALQMQLGAGLARMVHTLLSCKEKFASQAVAQLDVLILKGDYTS